ncbi:MAG: HD domain-containing protein [Roseburia sp.]|nr:HD domain-containing protein [Roseburia sp.]
MIYIYWLAFAVAVGGALLIVRRGKIQSVYHPMLGLTIVVCNAGYLALALSRELSTAVLANKITYVSCFLPFFIFMIVTELCGIKIKGRVTLALAACSFIVLLMAFTAGYSDIYYKDIEMQVEWGVTHLIKTYGPGHILYDSLLCFYVVATVGFLLYALTRRTQISYKTLLMMGVCLLSGIVMYELQRLMGIALDFMPLTYDIMLIGLIVACSRIDMYDMSQNVLNAWEHMEEYGYITFDTDRKYMGCNALALKYFDKLSECKIDSLIGKTGDEKFDELMDWMEEYQKGKAEDVKTCGIAGRIFRFNIKDLLHQHSKKRIGYLLEFFDVTQEQKYINMIENYNSNLEQEVEDKIAHISNIKDMMVLGMASMVENRDSSTGGHIRRTAEVVAIFARKLMERAEEYHVTKEFLNFVIKAAPMHDLGKIAVNDSILRKQGDYIEKEYEEMKLHAAEGARIIGVILQGIEDDDFVSVAKNMAHYHHEKWNGKGYPEGLAGEAIPLEARIMALADVFDALVSKRCYKEAYSYDLAFEKIEQSLGEHFDPELGKVFLMCRPKLEALYDKWKTAEQM